MNIVGIAIDYSNICQDYNTAYLDRDNKDPETAKCMKKVVAWTKDFLSKLCGELGYGIYPLNSDIAVKIDDVASNRFLFYSLEKEITLQSFVATKVHKQYDNATAWAAENEDGVLIQNDEEGEGIYLYMRGDSNVHSWIIDALKDFSLDEVPLPAK